MNERIGENWLGRIFTGSASHQYLDGDKHYSLKAERGRSNYLIAIHMPPSQQSVDQYVANYRNKAEVLRKIHSFKAEKSHSWDLIHTLATLVLGAIITFVGFMGSDRLADLINPGNATNAEITAAAPCSAYASRNPAAAYLKNPASQITIKKNIDMAFALAALLLFIASLLNLIYRWKEEHTVRFQAVVKLTTYINWLDELSFFGLGPDDQPELREILRRYQCIVENLPPNADRDYRRAKETLKSKSMK